MGMERLKEISPFVKEAFQRTLRAAEFLCFLHVADTYLCSMAKLVGPSMLPTFNHGNIALTERISGRWGQIEVGDVVLIRSPENPRKVITKRIKGVEGEMVSYLVESGETKNVVVPGGHVWIEGDNPSMSRDSRVYGPVPYALLHSRIFMVIWPPEDFKFFSKAH